MEPAPLTQAHAHARAAFSHQSHLADLSTASEEHALAAGEFAQAVKGTGDAEAMRTLRLLEQHHQKLHDILEFRSAHPALPKTSAETPASSKDDASTIPTLSPPATPETTPKRKEPASSTAQRTASPNRPSPPTKRSLSNRSAPARDLTSSIASNLASARGIPSTQRRRGSPASPTLSAQHAGSKMSGASGRHREGRGYRGQAASEKGASLTPPNEPSESPAPASEVSKSTLGTDSTAPPPPQDEPFQRFYSTFEGLLSRLSAPLAFAGLPLAIDNAPPPSPSLQPPPRPDRAPSNTTVSAEPDLNRLFSRAALRAARDGPLHGGTGGGESFYVVPSTGGTISYAGILSRAEQERRLAAGSGSGGAGSNISDDDFVDAREVPGPPSPDLRRHGSNVNGGVGVGSGTKTMEELQLENQALKQLSDTLSKRLHMWEVNAQSSSLALQQSLRVMQHHSSASASSPPVSEAGAEGKEVRELEERLAAAMREIAKLKEVIGRYRSKWEKLKEGARARREGGGKTEDGGRED